MTFLFSDMEGSTRLVEDLGSSAFATVLEQHHRLLRTAFRGHQGVERGTEGDSFLVVFTDAPAAVAAAVDAQVALTLASWPAGVSPRVRMGLHTGTAILGGDDYVGIDINRAARIAAAGHGGQVLLSEATRFLVERDLPEGVRIRPLGSYRLKDLPDAEPLHQLEIRGLPATFPPLRALDVRRAHLPQDATSFIGREEELATLTRLARERRLLTLTGPGGIGKSRLALRTAAALGHEFGDGTFFVPLATVREASRAAGTIASTLDLPEDPNRPIEAILMEWLGGREMLLVLDNLEQLSGGGDLVASLLAASSGLRVVATSRSPLRISGEQEYDVRPLPSPDPRAELAALEASDAVRLFVDRARLVRPDFSPVPDELSLIAEITARVDGLPLSIELAAARLRLLPLAAIRDRLAHRLDALVGGPSDAPGRQQSLRGTIAWSHDLLDESGTALFRRLAVFVGGWTLEAATEIVAGGPVTDVEQAMTLLIDQSLVQPSPIGGTPRFTMLPTIAEFATEQLAAAAEAGQVEERHATFFRRLAEAARAESEGPQRGRWFDALEADLDNLRAAIERSVAAGDHDRALAIAAALGPFWLQRNHSAEGQRLLLRLIEGAPSPAGLSYAAAAGAAATNATWLGDYATARVLGERGVSASREAGDRNLLAIAMGTLAFSTIEIDPEAALRLMERNAALYQEMGDTRGLGQSFLGRATALFALGRLAETRAALEHALELLQSVGDEYFAIFTRVFLGRIKLLMGDAAGGFDDYRAVLERSSALDLRLGIAVALDYIAEVAIWGGDVRRAVRLGAAAGRLKEELGGGIPPRIGGALDPLEFGRSHLGVAEFEREAWAGRAMSAESAISEAVATPPVAPQAAPRGSREKPAD